MEKNQTRKVYFVNVIGWDKKRAFLQSFSNQTGKEFNQLFGLHNKADWESEKKCHKLLAHIRGVQINGQQDRSVHGDAE